MNATLELPVDLIEYIKAEAARHRQTVDALLRDALAREGEGTFESAFDNVEAIKQHMSQTYGRLPDSVDSIQEDRDRMLSEYRGSTIIERYIDASDSTLPDFTTTSTATLDSNYRFRQVSTKKFAP